MNRSVAVAAFIIAALLSSLVTHRGEGSPIKMIFIYLLIVHCLVIVAINSLHEYIHKALPTH